MLAATLATTLLLGPLSPQAPLFSNPDQVLKAPAAQRFGWSADVDGDVLAVSSEEFPDGVYVYERGGPGQPWTETVRHQLIEASSFGNVVALSGDTLAVVTTYYDGGPPNESAVRLYGRDVGGPGAWGFEVELPQGRRFEQELQSLAIEGDLLVCGVGWNITGPPLEAGWIEVFERDVGGAWSSAARFTSDDDEGDERFGEAVAVDAGRILVGASYADVGGTVDAGAAYVYELVEGAWLRVAQLSSGLAVNQSRFASGVALVGDTAFLGARPLNANQPSLVRFERDAFGVWTELGVLEVPGAAPLFASNLAAEGEVMVASASLSGTSATVFGRDQGGPEAWGAVTQLASYRGYQAGAVSAGDLVLTAPNELDAGFAQGLAFDAQSATAYAVDEAGRLFRVDTTTGLGTEIGHGVGFGDIEGLAWDPVNGALYGADSNTDQLLRIDHVTGFATAIGPLQGQNVYGLAFDGAGVLYGLRQGTLGKVKLVVIDPATGTSTVVGETGENFLRSLAYDAGQDVLYAGGNAGQLYSVDPSSGAASFTGLTSQAGELRGLTFVPGAGALLSADQRFPSVIASVDPTTAVATELGPLAPRSFGAVHTFAMLEASATYCTAGSSASGCSATIGTFGSPSATWPSGFALHAAGVEGGSGGLFFFGVGGRQAQPWGNGSSFQCVVPPVARLGLLSGTGSSGACDGAFYQDVNALWCPTCPKPNVGPGAGAVVQAQLWYRDPFSTSNQTTSLSNAVEFVALP